MSRMKVDKMLSQYEPIYAVQSRFCISINKVKLLCDHYPDSMIEFDKTTYIKKSIIEQWVSLRADYITSEIAFRNAISGLLLESEQNARKYFNTIIEELRIKVIPPDDFPMTTDRYYVSTSDSEILGCHMRDSLQAHCLIQAYKLSKALHITNKELERIEAQGKIRLVHKATKSCTLWVEQGELNRIIKDAESYVPLNDVISFIVDETASKFYYSSSNYNDLKQFVSENNYFQLEIINSDDAYFYMGKCPLLVAKDDAAKLCTKLYTWIAIYDLQHEEAIAKLISIYKSKYPQTIAALKDALVKDINTTATSRLESLMFLIDKLNSRGVELKTWSKSEISVMFGQANRTLSKTSCAFLGQFLKVYTPQTTYVPRAINFGVREIAAYSFQQMVNIGYLVFNEESWNDTGLVEKAVHNPKNANVWVYVAMHFFAVWRKGDFSKVELPYLPYSPQEMLDKIACGAITAEEYRAVVTGFIDVNNLTGRRPSKTQNQDNVVPLRMTVSESCMEPFGLILSIAIAHYQLLGKPGHFIKEPSYLRDYIEFFGNEFAVICSGKKFLNRAANKAVMQGIQIIGDEIDGLPQGYLLAAVARSHKGGYGTLPQTTQIYLKDEKFSGFSPEYILFQMTERGVCSFIIDMVLKEFYNKAYTELPIIKQTEAIKSLSILPGQTVQLLSAVQKARDVANQTVCELLSATDSRTILENIAFDKASGKDSGVLCAAVAAGQGCKYPTKESCFGCRFEIPTKAMLLELIEQLERLQKQHNATTNNTERKRLSYLKESVLLPKVAEILCVMKETCRIEEFEEYRLLMQSSEKEE